MKRKALNLDPLQYDERDRRGSKVEITREINNYYVPVDTNLLQAISYRLS